MKTTRISTVTALLVVSAIAGSCGPQISYATRFTWQPYDLNEYRQIKEGVTVEDKDVKQLPESFYATVQLCNTAGVPLLTDPGRQPVMGKTSLHSVGQMWYLISITNNTEHILRLNAVVIRLFDPAGNQFEPLSKDDVLTQFAANWPCPSQAQAMNQFRLIKFLDRNAEIVPNTTVTGWLAFRCGTDPGSLQVPGIWKLAIYEVPVMVDEAGRVTKTTRFELRTVAKKFVDTYRQDSLFAEKKLIESKEAAE